jgi:hypothetical protein
VAPRVRGDRAVDRGVAPGVSVSVAAMSNGVHVGFVLSRAASRSSLTFPVRVRGMKLVDSGEVGIELRDRSGRTVGGIGQVVVGDSTAGEGSGGESRRLSAARMEIVGKGARRGLSITMPKGLINHPKTQFPLVGSVIGWEGTTNAGYVDKAYPNTNSPDADYPAKKGLKVGSWSTGHEDYSFLRFPNSTFRPSGSVLNTASLRVWAFHSGACSGRMLVRRILNTAGNDWSAGTVTWSNKPTGTSSGEASTSVSKGAGAGCPDGWIPGSDGLNVTSVVEPWWGSDPNNQNNGLLLRADSTAAAQYKIIRGYDTTHPPELTVNYTLRPPVPSIPQIQSPIVDGEVKSSSVQVSATIPAYSGTGMVILFRVWRVAQGYCMSSPSECIDSALIPASSGQTVSTEIPLPDDSGYSVSAITMVQRPNGSWVESEGWANNPTRFAVDTLPDIEDEIITPISGLSASSPYYVPVATPTLSVRLVESVPNESFSTTFRVRQLKQADGFVGHSDFASPPQISTGSGTLQWKIPAGLLVNGRSYEWEVVVTETHPNQHTAPPSGGPAFRVNEQSVCSTIPSPPDGRVAVRCAKVAAR